MHLSSILNTLLDLGLSKETIVVIISTLPIVELRGALPVAINVFHLSWHRALPLAIAGNLIPVPLLLLFFGAISRRLSRIGIFRRWINWLEEHSRRRGKIIERYKRLGLILLVAIPLPFTGAWTGSLVATIFEVRFRRAFLAILTGVCIAGAIVTAICLLALKWL